MLETRQRCGLSFMKDSLAHSTSGSLPCCLPLAQILNLVFLTVSLVLTFSSIRAADIEGGSELREDAEIGTIIERSQRSGKAKTDVRLAFDS